MIPYIYTIWTDCYSITDVVPHFLLDWKDKIFTAGKCVNVLKYCDPNRVEDRFYSQSVDSFGTFDKKK